MKKYILILQIFFIACFPVKTFAGAWSLEKGSFFSELSSKFHSTDTKYNKNGSKKKFFYGSEYEEYRVELKMHYGVTNDINLFLSVPYKWIKYENFMSSDKNKDFEDLSFGLKYRIKEEHDSVACPTISLLIKGKVPLGYDELESPSIGDGETEPEFRLLIGRLFKNSFINSIGGEVGYQKRKNELPDKIPYFMEFNFRAKEYIIFRTILDGIIVTEDSGKEPDNQELIKKKYEEYTKGIFLINIGAFGTYEKMNGFFVELGYGYTFAGKNTDVSKEFIFNLGYNFKK